MILFNKKLGLFLFIFISSFSMAQKHLVWKGAQYSVYRDRIVQGSFVAKALTDKELSSNYQSPVNLFKSPEIVFKFSINGKDNEMTSGVDHHFVVTAANSETPLIKFGQQLKAKTSTTAYLAPNAQLTIHLDMRDVLHAFKTQGYYINFKGDKIYKDDFKGVYVAGNTAPLIWDFDNLVNHPQLQLHDEDGDGIYEAKLTLNAPQEKVSTASTWKATRDLSQFPVYRSEYKISDALYNLATEEMIKAVEPDSTFRTGKEWAGVWTRDISYSIILSMAHLQPKVARYSLLKKVNAKKRIIQDTGTGGAWPVSSDRMIWAVAAWELYKATGDKNWLREAYAIIKNSVEDDLHTIYDPHTGMVKGESSFLDWREQTYPAWMQPVDIAESECLGTNAVHYEANIVLSKMAALLGDAVTSAKHKNIAATIRQGVNKYLWQPHQQYYAQYVYGRNYKLASPRAEALGEALAVVFGLADEAQQKAVLAHVPVMDFGISCIYPQIPNIPPYHNNAVWPFVQTYWLWAAAKAGNEKSAMESIAGIYRPAAMFITNKENFVAENGDFLGTQINSSNMLWSLSGSLSLVHKVFFGMRFNEDGLSFEPFVPLAFRGVRHLDHFTYRNALLHLEMTGFGNKIEAFFIDGKKVNKAVVTSDLTGEHSIKIVLANNNFQPQAIHHVGNYASLPSPLVSYKNEALNWEKIKGAKTYQILQNGKAVGVRKDNHFLVKQKGYSEYQVIAVDEKGVGSFASEPVVVMDMNRSKIYEAEAFAKKANEAYKGFSGDGFVEISKEKNTALTFPITIDADGLYAIDFRYANGNGPTNTENKCAIRTLLVDNKTMGTAIFPQRGKEVWSDWGYSNSNQVFLQKGPHNISLYFESWNENMNGVINQAMIDQLRIIKIGVDK